MSKKTRRAFTVYEIRAAREKSGLDKFDKRLGEFEFWLQEFIAGAKTRGRYPPEAQLFYIKEAKTALALNSLYWMLIEQVVRPQLCDYFEAKEAIVNHYKMAATKEFVIMSLQPFVNNKGEPIKHLNADFAFFVTIQLLFNWNLNTKGATASELMSLVTENEPTMLFIKEHISWLNNHSSASQEIIFSNMQTMRLFHYWYRDPKEVKFSDHTD